jgi:ribosome modulation factor
MAVSFADGLERAQRRGLQASLDFDNRSKNFSDFANNVRLELRNQLFWTVAALIPSGKDAT